MLLAPLVLGSNLAELQKIGPWLVDVAAGLRGVDGYDRGSLASIELAVHELATNCINYAIGVNGRIELKARATDEDLLIVIEDNGSVVFDPAEVNPPDPNIPQIGGYGLMIVEKLSRSMSYLRTDSGNRWEVLFELPAAPQQP